MARVHSALLPGNSTLHSHRAPGDFLDTYATTSDLQPRDAADIIGAFPGWVQALVKLRGALVRPFGLMADPPQADGDRVGPFPLVSESDDEVLAGFDDTHLNFLVSVCRQDGKIHLSTWVRPHNFGGRAYLTLIMPFHIAVVRNALHRVARAR
ncbi:MAG: DUF2867 domain-containing protein [Pseudomonadota bacterium]